MSSREILIVSTASAGTAEKSGANAVRASASITPLHQRNFNKVSPVSIAPVVSRDQRIKIVILPYPIDSQVGSEQPFALESGFFKQAQRTKVVRNTGCLDPVQPQHLEGVRDEQRQRLQ